MELWHIRSCRELIIVFGYFESQIFIFMLAWIKFLVTMSAEIKELGTLRMMLFDNKGLVITTEKIESFIWGKYLKVIIKRSIRIF